MTIDPVSQKNRVLLIDDDPGVQRGVSALLSAAGFEVEVFSSGEDFLSRRTNMKLEGAVALMDVCMPGIQGLDLQAQLTSEGVNLPIVVMTAHGDIPMAVEAMRNGASDFLQKPFTTDEVLTALERAFTQRRSFHAKEAGGSDEIAENFAKLTKREREVLSFVVQGNTSKEMARTLGVSHRTVEVHRQHIMEKMKAGSLADLVRMTVKLDILEPPDQ